MIWTLEGQVYKNVVQKQRFSLSEWESIQLTQQKMGLYSYKQKTKLQQKQGCGNGEFYII